jgi:hypothetical protein
MFDNYNPIAKVARDILKEEDPEEIGSKRTDFFEKFRSYIQTKDLLAGIDHHILLC